MISIDRYIQGHTIHKQTSFVIDACYCNEFQQYQIPLSSISGNLSVTGMKTNYDDNEFVVCLVPFSSNLCEDTD